MKPNRPSRRFVCKIFQKPQFQFASHLLALDYYKVQLAECSNCMPYLSWHVDDTSIYLIRPWAQNTL